MRDFDGAGVPVPIDVAVPIAIAACRNAPSCADDRQRDGAHRLSTCRRPRVYAPFRLNRLS
jgi:hypothetical protein